MVNPIKVGLVFAVVMALWHTTWSILVLLGQAQPLIDFVFWMHFITPPYRVEPFDLNRALVLVGVTFGIGLAVGVIGGVIWNVLHPRSPREG